MPGEKYDLLFEVYAGHYYPDEGGCATGPVLPGTLGDPKQEGRRARVGHSTIGLWNEDAYQLWLDVSTLQMLLDELPEDSLRASKIADGLELYTRIVDFEQPAEARNESYRKAREALKPLMEAHNGTTRRRNVRPSATPTLTLRGCGLSTRPTARPPAPSQRSFDLLERYPEYRYLQSQPAAYEMCEEYYPELFARIHRRRQKKAAGLPRARCTWSRIPICPPARHWCVSWSTASGFTGSEFGVESRMLWLPDTFGYSAVLPQLLRDCGVEYLVTQKIFWSYNEGDPFPYHYFTWKGMDGSVGYLLPADQLYLPHRPQGALRRMENPCAEAASG